MPQFDASYGYEVELILRTTDGESVFKTVHVVSFGAEDQREKHERLVRAAIEAADDLMNWARARDL